MIWTAADCRNAPVGDFPPRWASSWGDDAYGLWAALQVNACVQRVRWIEPTGPAGFLMGSPLEERAAIQDKDVREWASARESDPHVFVVDEGFWLAETPCTQAIWVAVMGDANPSHFANQEDSPQCPVERVSWDDAQEFISTLQRRRPELGDRASLPTEVQWEYAARAGSRTAYPWGNQPDDRRANWANQHHGTTSVGQFPPNAFGMLDMHGNVWEWCADPWRAHLPGSGADEGEKGATWRVVRGGSWISRPGRARSAVRRGRHPGGRTQFLGFRLALRSSSSGSAR